MFKVSNKDTEHIFPPCSSVSTVNFEHVIADWDGAQKWEVYPLLPRSPVSSVLNCEEEVLNLLSANSKLPTNCLSVFDHFVGLALKWLTAKVHNSSQ